MAVDAPTKQELGHQMELTDSRVNAWIFMSDSTAPLPSHEPILNYKKSYFLMHVAKYLHPEK